LKKCSKASGSIKKSPFTVLEGKTVTVDASIYIYKFLKLGRLAEKMHDFMRLCMYYRVNPIFIFDGKPPVEKAETLRKRKEIKTAAAAAAAIETDFNISLQNDQITMTKEHVEIVKYIISTYKFKYMTAPSEADALCAQLVHQGAAWACFSDDMDMFVYGCPRIVRELNMKTHSFMLYDMETILKTLDISQKNMTYMCILCGTDYTLSGQVHKFTTDETRLCHFNHVHDMYITWRNNNNTIEFIDWIYNQYSGELDANKPEIEKIYNMFSIVQT
jgi:flap endonuclease-1